MKTYKLKMIEDLLQVPIERREDCVREILLGLALHDLAVGELEESGIQEFEWCDDGKFDAELFAAGGEPVLRLAVTESATSQRAGE